MKVTISRSKNRTIYYISKSIRLNGRSTTRTVEKLGTEEEVRERAGGMDPYEWAKQYAAELTRREKESGEAIRYSPTRLIRKNAPQTINISYLFPQDIYYDLGINELCDTMTEQYSLPFDFNRVFSRLIYTRVIYHASKHGTYELSKNFLEKPQFSEADIDRTLKFLSVTPLTFQRQLYQRMISSHVPDGRLLFYDCTNYYLETGEHDFVDSRSFGRETPSTPIVQLGLLTDANGLPLSFDMLRDLGAKPPSMTSLEHEIIDNLKPEQIIVCSDAGLTTIAENKFIYDHDYRFIHIESMRKLDPALRSYAVNVSDWHIANRKRTYRIDQVDEKKYFNTIFYKERTLMISGKLQRMIVTFSMSQQARQRWIRQRQLTRVNDIIEAADNRYAGQSEYIRRLEQEEQLDGFSVFFTDSDLNPQMLIPVIRRRREIEENFRTVKRELRSRTLNMNAREKLYAHFMICFISSLIERIIEMKLHDRYSFSDLSDVLREMDMLDIPSEGYIPIYSRNDLTDAIHEAFGFRTDNQITSGRTIRRICVDTRKKNTLSHKK